MASPPAPPRPTIRAIVDEKGEGDYWLYRVEYEGVDEKGEGRFEWVTPDAVSSTVLHRWLRPSTAQVKEEELGEGVKEETIEDVKPSLDVLSGSLKRPAEESEAAPPSKRIVLRADGVELSADEMVGEQARQLADARVRIAALERQSDEQLKRYRNLVEAQERVITKLEAATKRVKRLENVYEELASDFVLERVKNRRHKQQIRLLLRTVDELEEQAGEDGEKLADPGHRLEETEQMHETQVSVSGT